MPEPPVVWGCVGVGFTYHETSVSAPVRALHTVDLTVHRGEMMAVLGAEGSGTSTLCRLAADLLDGRGTVHGSLRRAGDAGSAMLGDDPEAQLTGMTTFVDDEVRLPRRLHGRLDGPDAVEVLAELGVEHLSGRRVDTLSGGERQLVALASLVSLRPALLVLDQPSLSLDPDARTLLARALRRFCDGGGAVLLAGHQHDELSVAADRIAVLQRGTITRTVKAARFTAAACAAVGVWSTESHRSAPAADRAPVPAQSRLRVENLRIARGERVLVDDLDLSLGVGEVVALVGANGVGKSTVLRAIAGLSEPDARVSGEFWVGDAPDPAALHAVPAHRRAPYVGWVGQDPSAQLSASSVRGELERGVPLPPHRRRDRRRLRAERSDTAATLLETSGLAPHAETHPFDLGQAQRTDLVIATAQLLGASVLLLDEPTLGRDFAGMQRLDRTISTHADGGGAVILTTHDLQWARSIAHRIVHLGD